MTAEARPLFRLSQLTKVRQGGESEFHLCVPELTIRTGEKVAITGPSGCGKSTLLDLLAMVLRPDSAETFSLAPPDSLPTDIGKLWRERRSDALAGLRRRYFGYVLQTGRLFGYLTVRENIALSRNLLGQADDGSVDYLAERLGIASHLAKYPEELSVGERQRVAVARALSHEPSVVIADEPTASLDPVTAESVMALLIELVEERGMTAVVASHDWDQLERFSLRRIPVALSHEDARIRACFQA